MKNDKGKPPVVTDEALLKRTVLSDFERLKIQEKMRDKAKADLVKHAIVEWTLVRSLAWSERIIVVVASLLFLFDKTRDVLTFSGGGFIFFSLVFLGPVYGILMFVSLLAVYAVLRRMRALPKNVKGFRRIIYPVYACWFPAIYILSYYAMDFYYDLLKSVPVWDKVKEMWFK